MKEYSILVGGEAGEGSKKAGLMIAKLLSNFGYRIYIYEDYQSIIKGGHNFSLIRASEKRVLSSNGGIDFLLALNEDTSKRHLKKLDDKDHMIYNLDAFSSKKGIGVPIDSITKELGGISIMKNTALVAAFAKTIGIDWGTVRKVFKVELPIETDKNLEIAKKAYDRVERKLKIEKLKNGKKPLVSGNEAIALGALKSGLEAYLSYPMTPATGILNYMSSVAQEHRLKVFQPENEIAVVNAAIGLAFAGMRTMIGTSGGGFALMNEALSLSAQAEIPLVVVEAQRMGPSTGVPTYGGQSDLLYVLSSGHGDFDKFVVAPGDEGEVFYLSGLALNIAWKYQIPAIILSDKELSESTYSFDEKLTKTPPKSKPLLWNGKGVYGRYKITKDGISPMAFPGRKGIIVKGISYEHDEDGITVDDEKSIKAMQDKRIRKFKTLKKEVDKIKSVKVYGNKKSTTALVVWGSVKGAALEAAESEGFRLVQPTIMSPFPDQQMKAALKGTRRIIVAELNSKGQLATLLRGYGISSESILKYTGRPFTADELIKKIKSHKKNG